MFHLHNFKQLLFKVNLEIPGQVFAAIRNMPRRLVILSRDERWNESTCTRVDSISLRCRTKNSQSKPWTSHRCDSPHVASGERIGWVREAKPLWSWKAVRCATSVVPWSREYAERRVKRRARGMSPCRVVCSHFAWTHPPFREPHLATVENRTRPLLIVTYGSRGFGTRAELMC